MRLAILFLAITWLALVGLSSATVRFAVILRDRAKSDLVTSSDSNLDITFQNLMDNVIMGMVIVALASALLSIFGFVLVIYSKWLQEDCSARFYHSYIEIVVSLIVLSLGGYAASHVHGFQTAFKFLTVRATFRTTKLCIMEPSAWPPSGLESSPCLLCVFS